MDKEVVVHMHKGILLNCKKEHRWVSSNEVDEPRAYYRVKSEIEKWILYINGLSEKSRARDDLSE